MVWDTFYGKVKYRPVFNSSFPKYIIISVITSVYSYLDTLSLLENI